MSGTFLILFFMFLIVFLVGAALGLQLRDRRPPVGRFGFSDHVDRLP